MIATKREGYDCNPAMVVSFAKCGGHISHLQGLSSSTSFTTMPILLYERRACNEGKLCDEKVATVPRNRIYLCCRASSSSTKPSWLLLIE